MHYSLKLFLIVFSLFSLFSCGNKKGQNFRPPEISLNQNKMQACGNLALDNKTFNKNEILSVFDCLSWKENYPSLYQYIKKLDENNWNQIIKSWNDNFWSDSEKLKKTKLKWKHFKKSHKNTNSLTSFVEGYLKEPSSFNLPVINNQAEREQWVKVFKSYDLIQKIFLQFEIWTSKFRLKHSQEFLNTAKVLPGLIQSSNALSQVDLAESETYKSIIGVLLAKSQNKVSWPIDWARFFSQKQQPEDFRDALFLNSAKNNFLMQIPALQKLLNQGIRCFDQTNDKHTASLIENYQEVAQNLAHMTKTDSMLEILDLRSKLLGLRNYCNLTVDDVNKDEYQVAIKTLDTLDHILVIPNHFEVLQTLLQSLESQHFNLDDLLQFYSDQQINITFNAWLGMLNDENVVKFVVNSIGSFEDDNFQSLSKLLISSEMHQLLKVMSENQEILRGSWKFTLDFTNFYLNLKDSDSSMGSFIEFLFPQEILLDLITRSDKFELSELIDSLANDRSASSELVQFIHDGKWIELFDLLFSTQADGFDVSQQARRVDNYGPVAYPLVINPQRENALIQNCFWDFNLLRPLTLQEMVEKFPTSCESVVLRKDSDFAFRVIKDLASLNKYSNIKLSTNILGKLKILESDTLRFIGDLMVAGDSYHGGFKQFWNDLVIIFYNSPFQRLITKTAEAKFNIDGLNLKKQPTVQDVAPFFTKLPEIYSMLKNFILDDTSKQDFPGLAKSLNDAKFNAGKDILFFNFLSENKLDAQLQNLLIHASLKNQRYLQLILNDLVASKNALKSIATYQQMLTKVVRSSTLQGLLELQEKDVADLEFLVKDINLLNVISKMDYLSVGKSVNALAEFIELLKPFVTKSSFNWAGKSLHLLLAPVEVSAGVKFLSALSYEKKITLISQSMKSNFTSNEIVKLSTILAHTEGLGSLFMTKDLHIENELESLISFYQTPAAQIAFGNLAKYFSNPALKFEVLSKSFDSKFLKELLAQSTKEELLNLYHYYFGSYGPSLIKISSQATIALKRIVP